MSETPEFRYEVTLYPAPVLRRESAPVEAFDEELRLVVAGMFACMYASKGVGLAAPQVGLKRRLMILNPTGEQADELVLVNPTLVRKFGSLTTHEEGCLSFPGIYGEVERPESCKVSAFTAEGEAFEGTYGGFTSRVIQHEYDHLEGVLLVDRMSPADKQCHRAALQELVDRFKRARAASSAADR